MTHFGWIFLAFVVLSPGASFAQSLSISEQAARDERAATQTERRLNKKECAWLESSSLKTVSPAPGVTGHLLHLDDIQIVKTLEMRRTQSGDNGFSIQAYAPLPNGGIAGKDFCALVQFFTFERPVRIGAVTSGAGVLLRDGVDLARDYPNTSRAINAGSYLAASPEGAWLVFDMSNRKIAAWWATRGATWISRRKEALAFSVDNRLFYPVIVN